MPHESQFDYQGRAEIARKAQTDFHNYSANLLQSLKDAFQKSDRTLYQKLLSDFTELRRTPVYPTLLQELDSALEAAYPAEFWESFERLRTEHDSAALDIAIEFLEADPYFFRSGYTKEKLMRYIRHYELTLEQSERLRILILKVVDTHFCREFYEYRKLARKIDSFDFRTGLQARLLSANQDVKSRAAFVFAFLRK